jgi:hypothetical protein
MFTYIRFSNSYQEIKIIATKMDIETK